MAQRVVTRLVDDLDGGELAAGTGETVRFALDGADYEIDLSAENATRLRAALEPYVANGRKRPTTSRRPDDGLSAAEPARRGAVPRASFAPEELANIRAWARQNGYTVSPRGRVSGAVREAYHAAQG